MFNICTRGYILWFHACANVWLHLVKREREREREREWRGYVCMCLCLSSCCCPASAHKGTMLPDVCQVCFSACHWKTETGQTSNNIISFISFRIPHQKQITQYEVNNLIILIQGQKYYNIQDLSSIFFPYKWKIQYLESLFSLLWRKLVFFLLTNAVLCNYTR